MPPTAPPAAPELALVEPSSSSLQVPAPPMNRPALALLCINALGWFLAAVFFAKWLIAVHR